MSTTEPTKAVAAPESPAAVSPTADRALLGGNELVADSFGEYVSSQWKKIKGGESGVLPVVIGLGIIVVIFQTQNGKFLSGGNLVNLIQQGGVFVMLGMAEIFVLLLGEIDLAAGFNMGVGGVALAELAAPPHNVPWYLAILAGIAVCTFISLTEGLLVTRLGLPSFIVSLAYYLGLPGVILYLLDKDTHASGGNVNISNNTLNDVVNGSLSPTAGWIAMAVGVALYAVLSLLRDHRRRRSGLVTPPVALTVIKIVAMAAAGVALVLICNQNRGIGFSTVEGVPWVVPLILAVLVSYTFLLNRTRFGRYLYAIGGNAEAARRAGISLNRIKLGAFVLTGFTAGIAATIYTSQQDSISSNVDGGTYVLYAVAAAVIGGTSLFGGRGKMIHAVLGGIMIAAIANGLGLLRIGAPQTAMINALVLLAAVTVDAVTRRGRTTT